MTALRSNAGVRVFYRDYVNSVSISSAAPEPLALDRVGPLADRLLHSCDNFLGIVDSSDTILQCYLDDDQQNVILELVYPEATGCLRSRMLRAQAMSFLQALPASFEKLQLEGAQYID
jgi:hypothetical protein